MICHAGRRSTNKKSGTPGIRERRRGSGDMGRRKKRIDWKGSNPPTHFPSGNRISSNLRKGLKSEFLKLGKRKKRS